MSFWFTYRTNYSQQLFRQNVSLALFKQIPTLSVPWLGSKRVVTSYIYTYPYRKIYSFLFIIMLYHYCPSRIRAELNINPFPYKPWFLCVCSISLLKTLREKEKLLVMSNSPFSMFSICLENFLSFSSKLKLLSANSFGLEDSQNLLVGKGLNWYQGFLYE